MDRLVNCLKNTDIFLTSKNYFSSRFAVELEKY